MNEEIKEALVKLLEALQSTMEKTNKSTGAFGDALDKEAKSLEVLTRKYQRASKGIEELDEAIKDGTVTAKDSLKTAYEYERQMRRSGQVIDEETKQRLASIKSQALKDMAITGSLNAFEGMFKGAVDLVISATKTVVSELQNNGNAFSMTSKLLTTGLEKTHQSAQTFSKGLQSMGSLLMMSSAAGAAGAATAVTGGILYGLGGAAEYASEKAKELAQFGVEVLTTEILKTITTFNEISRVGIIFGNGMGALSQEITKAGVDYKVFFDALKGSAADLVMIGGNAGAGALKVSETFGKMSINVRESLKRLGISTEDQIQGTAEYLAILSRVGKLESKTAIQLSDETEAYLTNLRVISSLTGEDAKKLQERARDASAQFAVQGKLNELGATAATKFGDAASLVGAKLGKSGTLALQQILVAGRITNTQIATAYEQVPELMQAMQQYIADVKDDRITSKQARENFQKAISNPALAQRLQSLSQLFGQPGLLINKYVEESESLAMAQRAAFSATAKGFLDASQTAEEQKNTTDKLTNSVVKASTAFEGMQAALQQHLYNPIAYFANAAISTTDGMVKKIDDALKALGYGVPKAPPITPAPEGRLQVPGFTPRQLPLQALGGIVNSPSIAGEAGPEAVVPLPDGRSIPTNLDLSPLVSVLQQQVTISSEMLDELRDTKYVQEKILTATM